jgi:hypothetical protein
MKAIVKYVYILFSITLLIYLLLPSNTFPEQIPDSLQSNEPGDTETQNRRAYFTNLNREEVLNYYENNLSYLPFFSLSVPTYRLNYPPEEANILIRDQTRSTFLEEIVHPLRESFFVNGFKPKEKKDTIIIEGKKWYQKITVKYVTSSRFVRFTIYLSTMIVFWIVLNQWVKELKRVGKLKKKLMG